MNGSITSVMYKMKPLFELSGDISVKTTMYGMKNFHHQEVSLTPSVTGVEENDCLIKEIENRQTSLLKALAEIRIQMAALKSLVCKSVDSPDVETCVPVEVDISKCGITSEVVVNASLNHPPYSLLGITKLWNGPIHVNLKNHVHSSVQGLPEHLMMFNEISKLENTTNAAELDIRLIWKNGCKGCEFLISPLKPLKGEVNFLRLLNSCISPNLDPVVNTQLDEKLDMAHQIIFAENDALKQLIECLSEGLNRHKWLNGDQISILDIATWSALKNLDKPVLNRRMKTWYQDCERVFGPSGTK